jgi:hypothetical protein
MKAKNHLDPCDQECKMCLGGVCCYGLRHQHCYPEHIAKLEADAPARAERDKLMRQKWRDADNSRRSPNSPRGVGAIRDSMPYQEHGCWDSNRQSVACDYCGRMVTRKASAFKGKHAFCDVQSDGINMISNENGKSCFTLWRKNGKSRHPDYDKNKKEWMDKE